jgi:hypothetical protein
MAINFYLWVDQAKEEKETRLRENRRNAMRSKVDGWLSDFKA